MTMVGMRSPAVRAARMALTPVIHGIDVRHRGRTAVVGQPMTSGAIGANHVGVELFKRFGHRRKHIRIVIRDENTAARQHAITEGPRPAFPREQPNESPFPREISGPLDSRHGATKCRRRFARPSTSESSMYSGVCGARIDGRR